MKLAGLMIGAPLAASSGAAIAAPASSTVDDALRQSMASNAIPGVVAFAATRDRILYRGAFGVADLETRRPMTEDAMFRIASMTKAITSTAAMQLVEQKRFTLDDPVEKYLPDFGKLQVFEVLRQRDRCLSPPPGDEVRHNPPSAHAHLGPRLQFHQPDVARFQAARRRAPPCRASALRARRSLALQHEHRSARPRCRGRLRSEPDRIFPRAHLHAAQDAGHALQHPGGQARTLVALHRHRPTVRW